MADLLYEEVMSVRLYVNVSHSILYSSAIMKLQINNLSFA